MHPQKSSTIRVLGVGLVSALMATATATAVSAEVYVPEGQAGTALRLNNDFAPEGRISGLGNVHGMTAAVSRGILISASLKTQPGANGGKVSLVSLIDMKTGKIKRQIELPGMVHHVTIGANDRYVLATHPRKGAVSIIDLETDKVTATLKTGAKPNYAVYDPKTASFYVSNAGNNTISRVDPRKGVVTRNYQTPGDAEHLAIDVPGRRLFAAEAGAGTLSVLNIDTGKVLSTTPIGGELHGVAYDAARDMVYVSAREKGDIARIDLKTGTLKLVPIGPQPYHMALDGKTLLISSAGKKVVWAVDPASGKILKTIPTNSRGHQMVVIPRS